MQTAESLSGQRNPHEMDHAMNQEISDHRDIDNIVQEILVGENTPEEAERGRLRNLIESITAKSMYGTVHLQMY